MTLAGVDAAIIFRCIPESYYAACFAKLDPMGKPEGILVRNQTVIGDIDFTRGEQLPVILRENMFFPIWSVLGGGALALRIGSSWKDESYANSTAMMAGLVDEVRGLVDGQQLDLNFRMHIKGSSLSRIQNVHRGQNCFPSLPLRVPYQFHPQPCSLINSNLSILGGSLVQHLVHRAVELALGINHCDLRLFHGLGTSLSGGRHLPQLAIVDNQSADSNYAKADLTPKRSVMEPMNFIRKLSGVLCGLIGICFAAAGHYSLLWKWDAWSWRRRLSLGISGWGLAAFFVCHAMSILLGV